MTQPEKTTPIGESPSPHAEARRAFPAGLEQPEGSFRFSVDALLLAAFAASRTADVTIRFIDLGTGCGVVGLAYLLLKSNKCRGACMDCNPELIDVVSKKYRQTRFFGSIRSAYRGTCRNAVFGKPPYGSLPGPVGHGEPAVASCRLRTLTRNRGPPKSLIRG